MSTQPDLSQPKMGQCQVTGVIVPEDELVTINGQRVCAQGKAILLERLRAGEAMPGEWERPTVMRRFGCIFLDGIILGIPSAIVFAAVAFGAGRPGEGAAVFGGLSIVIQTIQVCYYGLLHGSRGQTVGKMAGKLLVVNQDGSPITMSTAFLRAFALCGPGYLNGLAAFGGDAHLANLAQMVVGAYAILNVVLALVDSSQQRALHDRIAGTRVVVKG